MFCTGEMDFSLPSSNVEIKAKVRDLTSLLEKAKLIANEPGCLIRQEDTYFCLPGDRGRLKLRQMDECSQLVFYKRNDTTGPKVSRYHKQDFENASEVEGLKKILAASLEIAGVVKKQRHLFMAGQTRIHIDDVEGLGHFMELEVVLHEGQTPDEGTKIAETLMHDLNISKNDLLPCSYIDLLLKKRLQSL